MAAGLDQLAYVLAVVRSLECATDNGSRERLPTNAKSCEPEGPQDLTKRLSQPSTEVSSRRTEVSNANRRGAHAPVSAFRGGSDHDVGFPFHRAA